MKHKKNRKCVWEGETNHTGQEELCTKRRKYKTGKEKSTDVISLVTHYNKYYANIHKGIPT